MTRTLIILLITASAACSCLASHPGDVTARFRATELPTGLAWDGDLVWMADRDSDWLYGIDPETGQFADSVACPSFSPLGLAFGDGCLWVSGYREDVIYRLDAGERHVVDVIEAPSSLTAGLAWESGYLWACDASAKEIVKIDPKDGTPVRSIKAPSSSPHGLAFDGEYLWVSDRKVDKIYLVEPGEGWVIAAFDAPGPYPRGLACDGNAVWSVDYQTDSLYALRMEGDENVVFDSPKRATVSFAFKLRSQGPRQVDRCDIYLALPHDDLEHQTLLSHVIFNPEPSEVVKDRWEQEFAHFVITDVAPGETARVSYEIPVEIRARRQIVIPRTVGSINRIPRELKTEYTVDGARLLIDDPVIQNAIREAVGDEDNPYWIARKIFEYVNDRVKFERVGGWDTAPNVLRRGTGSCSEFAFVFMAMARGAGIPTRFCAGVCERGDEASMDDVFHRWTEVYLPNYGWVPMDASATDSEWQADRIKAIGSYSGRILITTVGGGDSEYLGWSYNYGFSSTYAGRASADISAYADWEPVE